MNFARLVRSGVSTANRITKSLQVSVRHKMWTGQSADGYGTPIFASPVTRLAIVNQQQQPHFTSSGEEVMSVAYVCFVYPVTPNGASGRVEPVDQRDQIVLPDGTVGVIVDVNSFLDPKTNRGYLTEVWLGSEKYQKHTR